MNDGGQSALTPMDGNGSSEQSWAHGDFAYSGQRPASDFASGLVSLGFIKTALRRSAVLWCAMAAAGLLIGLGVYVALPRSYQATTSVELAPPPNGAPDSILTDVALAQSHAVAGLVVHRLGLRQSISGFLSTYSVTEVTDRILDFTVSAPTSSGAVTRARTLTTQFLRFRADQLETEQNLGLRSLARQISQDRRQIASITARISQYPANPSSPQQQDTLSELRTERSTLTTLAQTASGDQANLQAATAATMRGSTILDAAVPVAQSRLKHLLEYSAAGLIAGLALGVGVVVVKALVSDRLRRRDDVAYVVGAPVKLSVRFRRLRRLGRRGMAAIANSHVRQVAAHLHHAVPPRNSRGPAGLAVVAVDNAEEAALPLLSLAMSSAREGKQVVVADLSSGGAAARLLGVKEPGERTVTVDGLQLVVALPGNSVMPVGPLHSKRGQRLSAAAAEIGGRCASADLLLTLATLDPALGGDHLATWATDAVIMVTAGRSSWTKIHAAGEMIRIAGIDLRFAVLLGADKTDESLGVPYAPRAMPEGNGQAGALHSIVAGFGATANGDSGRPSPDS